MTEFALAPATTWDSTTTPYRSPRVMLEQNQLQAYRVRGNGTMRHVSLYVLGSTGRDTAEYINDRVDMEGASVQAVARELHVSTATVRRYLEGLELTEEIESGEWDGLYFNDEGEPVWTRGLDLTDGDTEDDPAPQISEDAPGAHNEDEPVGTTNDNVEQALAASLAAKDAELLARNQARITNAPKPSARVAASVRATRPAQDQGATPATVRSTTAASAPIPVCFCGDQGAHGLGATGCKNAPVRKVRNH